MILSARCQQQIGLAVRRAFPDKTKKSSVSGARYLRSVLRGIKPVKQRTYQVVTPATVSALRQVPPAIDRPSYAESGIPQPRQKNIDIKDEETIEAMRVAGQLARAVLQEGGSMCREGVTTDEIDVALHNMIVAAGAYPSPLNYRHFPKAICSSVNNVLCHGIPDSRPLQNGDIISLDITVYTGGVHGDTCATFFVGSVDEEGQELVSVARKSLWAGIEACGPGRPFSAIPMNIWNVIKGTGFSVCDGFAGHGIGSYFHGPPFICHTGTAVDPGTMEPGMTFTIEPIVTEGSSKFRCLSDKWTAVTTDNGRAAAFEHTLLITGNGVEVLTG